ncbi:hypothetical protein [Leptospira perolatii]|nr:hypothetical protein [Leptospira perolatii]
MISILLYSIILGKVSNVRRKKFTLHEDKLPVIPEGVPTKKVYYNNLIFLTYFLRKNATATTQISFLQSTMSHRKNRRIRKNQILKNGLSVFAMSIDFGSNFYPSFAR